MIVGAGAAGCVLAHRLTEDASTRVLLIEAGGRDIDPFIHVPIGGGRLWKERLHEWGYDTEPQPALDGTYTVFGRVVEGLDVVRKIEGVKVESEKPVERVDVYRMRVSRRN